VIQHQNVSGTEVANKIARTCRD